MFQILKYKLTVDCQAFLWNTCHRERLGDFGDICTIMVLIGLSVGTIPDFKLRYRILNNPENLSNRDFIAQ